MRQRKLGSHTPPCHRRMVITTLFSVMLAALQRRPVLYHTRWLLTGGGGGGAPSSTLFIARSRGPLSAGWAPALRRLAAGVPPPFPSVRVPDVRVSAVPRLRSCAEGRGCPTCPRAQQCRIPHPTAVHVAHCLCLCVAQTQRRGSRGCCSGRLALAQCCGGEKSAAPTFDTGSSSGSTT